jgi:hypothetical protein
MNEKSDLKRPIIFCGEAPTLYPDLQNCWSQVSLYYLRGLPNTSEEIGSKY